MKIPLVKCIQFDLMYHKCKKTRDIINVKISGSNAVTGK